ncbi:hypothetical protein [Thermococcus sp. JCM 11816]|uniref:hypothetical protein n=1 Tax=Thermococcus sp. (strain JCM 11816 / KS-1) TaxID=1295125 RepID=UPI000A5C4D71
MPVEIETEGGRKLRGRVLTVSGGRVRVDFNHPYAGKHLVYEVEIVEKIDDPIEKVKALIELRLPRLDANKVVIEVGEKDVVVDFTPPVKDEVDKGTLVLGELLLEGDLKFLGYEEVKFRPSVDELLKPQEAEEGEVSGEEAGETTEAPEETETEKAAEQEAIKEAPEEKSEEKGGETEESAEESEAEEASEKAEETEEKKPKKSTKSRKTRRTTRKKSTTKKKAKAAEENGEAEAENAEASE